MSDIERRIGDFLREEAEGASRPDRGYEHVLRRAKAGRILAGAAGVVAVVAVAMGSLAFAGSLRPSPAPAPNADPAAAPLPSPSASEREVRGCPVTIPPQPAFVPPSPYFEEVPNPNVPEADHRVLYGTERLWTWLDVEGEVWQGLPDDDGNGKFFEKTVWWAESYSPGEGRIAVTGRELDGPGSFEVGGPAGGGSRPWDVGSFMLVGVEVPPGCWEFTGSYRGDELSYVVLVEG